ncbi:hypothetical protein [Micromonospora avicenniae]|uniref:hypothetical protein n=1 Tax=Micromonospora avicenniae TaxID=1198245 RepID=UPI003331210F
MVPELVVPELVVPELVVSEMGQLDRDGMSIGQPRGPAATEGRKRAAPGSHQGWGMGSYCYCNVNPAVVAAWPTTRNPGTVLDWSGRILRPDQSPSGRDVPPAGQLWSD